MALFTGVLLVFGAVGGMDNPDQAEFFFHQLGAAFVGLFMMFMAVFTTGLTMEVNDD
jgi:hypothetical protein